MEPDSYFGYPDAGSSFMIYNPKEQNVVSSVSYPVIYNEDDKGGFADIYYDVKETLTGIFGEPSSMTKTETRDNETVQTEYFTDEEVIADFDSEVAPSYNLYWEHEDYVISVYINFADYFPMRAYLQISVGV